MRRRKRLFFALLVISIAAIGLLIAYYFTQYQSYQFIVKHRPYVLQLPTKITITETKKYSDYVKCSFGSLSVYLPNVIKKYKESKDSLAFKDVNKNVHLFISKKSGKFIPKEFEDKYKDNFEFFKNVLYNRKDLVLLNYKAVLIPYSDGELNVYEVKIGQNRGFLYKEKRGEITSYIFNLFFGDVKVRLHLTIKNNALTEEEIYYIISTLKIEE